MTSARVRWRISVVVIVVIAAVGLLLFGGRLRPESRRAGKRAQELNLVLFNAPELDGYVRAQTGGFVHAGMLLVRPVTADSSAILFRQTEGKLVSQFDIATGQKSPSTMSAWYAATGEVSDEAQHWIDCNGWTRSHDPPRLVRLGQSIETAGRHVMGAVLSSNADKVAVISADGWYLPAQRGMLLGGTWQAATGRHFLDVFSLNDGKRLMPSVAVPLKTSIRGGLDHFWTADERFIVCKDWQQRYCIVPTGLQAANLPVVGEEAARAGYGVFPLHAWWEHFPHLRVLVRYEENGSGAFLMHSKAAGSTYRYDPADRALTLVEQGVWESATGMVDCSRFATPFGAGSSGCETDSGEDLQVKRAALDTARAAMWQELRPNSTKKKLLHRGAQIPVAGNESVRVSIGSTLTRAVVLSKDDPRGEYFYHELFRLPEGSPIGPPLRLPRGIVDSGPAMHGWQPWPWDWGPKDRYILYMNWDRRTVCIVHTDLAQP